MVELRAAPRAQSADGAPLLGDVDGVTCATGLGAAGLALVPVVAELLAAHLAGEGELPAAWAPGRVAGAAA